MNGDMMDGQAVTMSLYALMIFLLMIAIPVTICLTVISHIVRKVKKGIREITR